MTREFEKQALNRKEGAIYLGLAENTFVKLLDEGKIHYARVGRRLIIPKASLDNYLDKIANGTGE